MGMLSSDPRPVVECDPDKGAQQSFKDECDINNIMKKYMRTGQVTHLAANAGRFSDVSEVGSYHEAVQRVRESEKFFLGLSTDIRSFFDNDTALFMDFILDPANAEEIRELGLDQLTLELEPVAPEEPAAPVIDDPVPESSEDV